MLLAVTGVDSRGAPQPVQKRAKGFEIDRPHDLHAITRWEPQSGQNRSDCVPK